MTCCRRVRSFSEIWSNCCTIISVVAASLQELGPIQREGASPIAHVSIARSTIAPEAVLALNIKGRAKASYMTLRSEDRGGDIRRLWREENTKKRKRDNRESLTEAHKQKL
ncbi:hypothetical protein Q5P01_009945 [Channa striata]|uniref:Uncharacterized protein n=1 Tax=Channa striata TaxID=64152 RepID=A0AA88N200_CHASR|nr:hypothetical protein Q5P01_009945 [Channa striata]